MKQLSTGKRLQDLELQKTSTICYTAKTRVFSVLSLLFCPLTMPTNAFCIIQIRFWTELSFLYFLSFFLWLNRACNSCSRIALGYDEVFENLLFFKCSCSWMLLLNLISFLQIARFLSSAFVPPFPQYGSNDAINYRDMKHCPVFIRPWQCGLCLMKQEITVPASVL